MANVLTAPLDPKRALVLGVGAAILLVPIVWIVWSVGAALTTAQAVRVQSETLVSLQERLSGLSGGLDAAADAASVYLPGETAAVAGAALQRIVMNTVEAAGGRFAESEIAPLQEGEEGSVILRTSFDTDIAGLQRVLFDLETGLPILLFESLSVQTGTNIGSVESEQPMLRVAISVEGYWQTEP